jgi:heptosyltransferase III
MQDLCAEAAYAEVWVPGAVVPLVQFAEQVRSIADTGIDSLGIPSRAPSPSLVSRLQSFDSIVSWYGANREEFGLAVRSLGVDVEFRTALPPAESSLHAVDFFLRSAGRTDRYPFLNVPAVARSEPFMAVHPFSGSTHKNWPLARFRELEQRLPLPLRYCVGPEQIMAGRSSSLDRAGCALQYASLYDLAAWIRGAAIYIGNDSGITHLAAACGVPTVALFGYSNPAIWAPRGSHVRVVAAASMLDLGVEAVLRAVDDLLYSGGPRDADRPGPQSVWSGNRP